MKIMLYKKVLCKGLYDAHPLYSITRLTIYSRFRGYGRVLFPPLLLSTALDP